MSEEAGKECALFMRVLLCGYYINTLNILDNWEIHYKGKFEQGMAKEK